MKTENAPVTLKIVYDAKLEEYFEVQMASKLDISLGLHVFSLAVQEGITIDNLNYQMYSFYHYFNKPYNYTMANFKFKIGGKL